MTKDEFLAQAAILVAALVIVLFAVLTPAERINNTDLSCDCRFYAALALNMPSQAPFVWRPMEPLLARLVANRMPIETAFYALTLVWLVLLGPACYFMLRSAGFTPAWSLVGALLTYTLYYLVIFNLTYPYMTDPPMLVFLALAIGFAYTRNRVGFMLALFIGVLFKETVLIAVPVWYALAERPRPYGSPIQLAPVARTFLLALPALLAFALIRTLVHDPSYKFVDLAYDVYIWRAERVTPIWEFLPFSFLPLLIPLNWTQNRHVLRQYAGLFALVYFQYFIASDTGRLLVAGFAPFVIMSVYGLQNAARYIRRYTSGKRQ